MMNFLACKATVDTEVTIGFRVYGEGLGRRWIHNLRKDPVKDHEYAV